jgi:hypothetical protein
MNKKYCKCGCGKEVAILAAMIGTLIFAIGFKMGQLARR